MKRPRKIRVRGSGVDKSQRKWLYGPMDPASQGVYEWDGSQPWSTGFISALQGDHLEALEKIYPKLMRREKDIISLLRENETNQSEIARILNMNQSNVSRTLRSIAKKILRKMI